MNLWAHLMQRGRRSQAWLAKAEALIELGRHEEAVADFDRALALDPRLAMALRGKARALDSMGKAVEALEAIELALKVDPKLALAWRTKGAILRGLGRDAEGLSCYENGLAIDPRDTLLWCNKGNVLLKLGRVAEAQASYQRALSIDPSLTDAINGMRSSYLTKSLRRECLVDGIWRGVATEPPTPPSCKERLVVTVASVKLLKRWLSVSGFDLREEIVGRKCDLVGGNFHEYGGHREASLWLDACRLGDWGNGSDHDMWFTFEPDAAAEPEGPQYQGWSRLAELLASNVEPGPPTDGPSDPHGELQWSQLVRSAHPSKRLTVFSYSSPDAEPEETFGNLLTGGSKQAEVSKSELENIISSDAVVTSGLDVHGYRLTDHFNSERRGSRSCSIVHGDQQVGRMVSYESNLSITLYRNCAEYSRILEVLRH